MLGQNELLVILGVVVLLFGANKLPELARGLGRANTEFRHGMYVEGDEENKKESGQ